MAIATVLAQTALPFIPVVQGGKPAVVPNPKRYVPKVTLTPEQSAALLTELAGTNMTSDVTSLRCVVRINGTGTNQTATIFTELRR